jgi:hypothetical protein
MKQRMPLLPANFDRRFFNAAPAGQVAPGFLKGDEPVAIEGVTPRGSVFFHLPGVPPPECQVELVGKQDHLLRTQLDTVIINMDDKLLLLLWRTHLVLRNGPHDVRSIKIRVEGLSGSPQNA